jgi:hypothetical protein
MTSQRPSRIEIDRVHTGAICAEIGERLRAALPCDPARLPPPPVRLMELVDSIGYREAPPKRWSES